MIRHALVILLVIYSASCFSSSISTSERKEILDTVRPIVAAIVGGQKVKIKVDHLNVDSNWAVLVSELVNTNGAPLDWSKSSTCNTDLDKMLWAVLAKADGQWRIAQVEACASEPPYWGMGYLWPCGVYKGFKEGARNLEIECRNEARGIISDQ